MDGRILEKYKKKLAREGILKAFLLALSIACAALAVFTLASWFFGFGIGLWLGIGLFVLVLLAATPLFYFLKYRPSVKEIARRIDALGLEERMLTMTELEGDESFMATVQRQDAMHVLGGLDHTLLKFAFSTALIIAVGVFAFVGASATTVDALYTAGVIPSGIDRVTGAGEKKVYTVSYSVEEGKGKIVYYTEDLSAETEVDPFIKVEEGDSAPAVYAVPLTEENWVFVRWTDGVLTPYREDVGVSADFSVRAVFAQLSDIDVEDPPLPSPPSLGEGGDPQEGEGDSSDQQQQPPDSNEGDGEQEEGGGARNDSSQNIFDGDTYYGDDYNNAYDESMGRLESDDSLSDRQKDWIKDYFDSIEKTGSGNDDDEGGN